MKQFIDPEWVSTWRDLPGAELSLEQIEAVVNAARSGASFDQTMTAAGTGVRETLKAVAAVGSRCTQIGKHEFKVTDIVAAGTGRAASGQHGPDGWVVAAAPGWLRTRRKGDVRRSYAALLVAGDRIVTDAIARTCAQSQSPNPLRYSHYADLYNAARGTLPALHKVTMHQPAVVPYLQAWDSMDTHAQRAVAAGQALVRRPTPDQMPDLLRAAFWLLPNTRILTMATRSVLTATSASVRMDAAGRLTEQLRRLADLDRRQPTRLRPGRLEQLTSTQLRALAALDGFRPGEGFGSRDDTSLARFAEQARTALAAV